MKKKPTSKEGATDPTASAANATPGESQPKVIPIEETSPFITPQMASCNFYAGDPTSVTPEDEKK